MAVVRNITPDELSVGAFDGPLVAPGAEHEVPDEDFVDRAWPTSTWELVTKPGKGYVDASPDDAVLYISQPDETVAELKQRAADEGVDITGLTKKADIAAALANGTTTEESA